MSITKTQCYIHTMDFVYLCKKEMLKYQKNNIEL
jgi:hypothetical protein